MGQLSLLRFFNAPKFPSSINHEEVLAQATPSSSWSPSSSSNVSPISISDEIDQETLSSGAAAAIDGQASGHAHCIPPAQSLARELHLPGRGLFPSFVDLVADIRAKGGRDAFVANLANNPNLYGSTRDTSRPSNTGDKDGIIYVIVNLANRKCYVGQTKNFDIRMGSHFKKSGYQSYLKRAINIYGRANFMSVILLAGIEKQKELDLTEIGVIKYLDCLAPENRGYNIHAGGRGGPQSAEHRKRISDGNKGKTPSKETRALISASKIGKPRTKEARAAISSGLMGKMKGKARSPEARAAISAGLKKTLSCPEARAAISAKISASKKGKARSDETRAAISAGLKKAVVITLLCTFLEIQCTSGGQAAREMGVAAITISKLVNKTRKKSTSKGGQYAGQLFTARFRE